MYGIVTGQAFVVQTSINYLFPHLASDFAAAWLGAANG